MKAVLCSGPGGPEVLGLGDVDRPRPLAGEVLIEVYAAGVNRPDLAQRSGSYPPPKSASHILGLEVAGVVAEVGGGVVLPVGASVCALVPGGGYAEYCRVPAAHCLPIPTGWSFEQAAGIPETYFTVWANLFMMGSLKAGEHVLVHGGSSGIGTTAIQLAREFGADAIVTAGSETKCRQCEQLGAVAAINYRTSDFESELDRITDHSGVDVVLDMIGGEYTEKNLRCLKKDGRLIQIATMHGSRVTLDLRTVMQKRLVITGSMMRPRSIEEKTEIANQLRSQVWPLLADQQLTVIMDRVFPLEEVQQAHRYLEAGEHFGKIILRVRSHNRGA